MILTLAPDRREGERKKRENSFVLLPQKEKKKIAFPLESGKKKK